MATSRRAARPAAAPQTFTLSPKEHHSLFTDADITIFGGSKLRRAVLRPVHAAAPSSAARAAQMRRDALHGAKPPSSPQTNGMVDARRKMYEPLGGTYVASPAGGGHSLTAPPSTCRSSVSGEGGTGWSRGHRDRPGRADLVAPR